MNKLILFNGFLSKVIIVANALTTNSNEKLTTNSDDNLIWG